MNSIEKKELHLLTRLACQLHATHISEATWKFSDQITMQLFIDLVEALGFFPNDDCFLMTVLITDERKIAVKARRKIRITHRVLGTETESDRRQAMNSVNPFLSAYSAQRRVLESDQKAKKKKDKDAN